jgi:Tfp pilus assembly protein PilN
MAVRDINLIPGEIVARRQFRRHIIFWTGWLVVCLSFIWGFYCYQKYRVLAEERTIKELKQQHLNLEAKIDEIRTLKAELHELQQRQAGLNSMDVRATYSQIFAKLADTMNEQTWLTQLLIDTSPEEGTEVVLRLTGLSLSAEELGNFLNQLSSEAMFEKVLLQNAREYESARMGRGLRKPVRLIQFDIACNI